MFRRPLITPSVASWSFSSWFTFYWISVPRNECRCSPDSFPVLRGLEGPALMSSLPCDSLTLIPVKPLIHSNPAILCWQNAAQSVTSLLISSKFQNNGNYSLCHHQLESRQNPTSGITSFLSQWSSWKYLPILKANAIPSSSMQLKWEGWFNSWRSQCSSVSRDTDDQMRPKSPPFSDSHKVRVESKLNCVVLFLSYWITSFLSCSRSPKVIWNSNVGLQSISTLILGNMIYF